MSESLQSWKYWRDKKGVEIALEEYYPNLLKQEPMLMAALVQMKSAEALINQIMNKKVEAEDDPEY
jgi:hypothetical protein